MKKGYIPFEDARVNDRDQANGDFTAFDLGFEEVNIVYSLELK